MTFWKNDLYRHQMDFPANAEIVFKFAVGDKHVVTISARCACITIMLCHDYVHAHSNDNDEDIMMMMMMMMMMIGRRLLPHRQRPIRIAAELPQSEITSSQLHRTQTDIECALHAITSTRQRPQRRRNDLEPHHQHQPQHRTLEGDHCRHDQKHV